MTKNGRTLLDEEVTMLRCLRFLSASLFIVIVSSVSVAYADVDTTGAFRTSVFLKVPAYHGLEPQLHLSYHSQRGNGWLGAGWNLSGLSAITRTSAGKGAPAYNNSDVFYLDGMELISCTPGMPSPSCKYPDSPDHQAYTTKIESFQRIASDFSAQGQPWYIWNKTGTKMTYEPGSHGSGISIWLLTSAEDMLGNKVSYTYWHDVSSTSDEGEYYIDRISYNGTVIKFYYELRPDTVTYAIGSDKPVVVRNRLKTIGITVGASRARTSLRINRALPDHFSMRYRSLAAMLR